MIGDVHVIPVPRDMSAEDAWAEIKVMGHLVGYRKWKPRFWFMKWAVITEVEQ